MTMIMRSPLAPPVAFLLFPAILLLLLSTPSVTSSFPAHPVSPDPSHSPSPLPSLSAYQPSNVWIPTIPLTLSYGAGYLYLIAQVDGSSPILQQRNATTLEMYRQLHLDSTYHIIRVYTTARSIWCDAWTQNDTSRLYTQWAVQVDISTLTVVHRVQLGISENFILHALYGVDSNDTTLLTPGVAGLQNELRLLNATTGLVMGNFTGGRNDLIAWDAVLHPITRAMVVEDWKQSAFLVISPLNNSVLLSIPFPPLLLPYSMSIDSTGTFLYSLWRNGTISPYPNTFLQSDLTSGKTAQMSTGEGWGGMACVQLGPVSRRCSR